MNMIPWRQIEIALIGSERAYEPKWGDVVYQHEATSSQAVLFELRGYLVLAFKGSAEFADWILDARALPPMPYEGQWVHRGFRRAHKGIWPMVYNHLVQLQAGKRRPLIVTGHSLGGALAELSCLFLHQYPGEVNRITFGKPNVFLKPPKARFDYLHDQVSVVSGSDIVTRTPYFLFGPDAGQTMLYLDNAGKSHWIPNMTPAMARFLHEDWHFADAGADHRLPTGYRRRLEPLFSPTKFNPTNP